MSHQWRLSADMQIRRVLHVTNRYLPSIGGVQTQVRNLSRALRLKGVEVEVLTHRLGDGVPFSEADDAGVFVRRFPTTINYQHGTVSRQLLQHLAAEDPTDTVLHLHSYHDPITLLAARKWDGRLVFNPYFHGSSASTARAIMHRVYRPAGQWIFDRADAIVCLTHAEAAVVRSHHKRVADKIEIVSSGIDVDRINIATPMPRDDHRKMILAAGRIEDYKQVELIVRAMRSLRSTHCLEIVGCGPGEAAIAQLIEELGLGDSVRMHGRVSDESFARWLRTADVVCSASLLESQGIVPLEAIVAGAAVVVSDIPAHAETSAAFPGSVTLFDPTATPEHLAAVLAQAQSRQSQRARRANPPSWSDVADRMMTTYGRSGGRPTQLTLVHRSEAAA